MRESDVEVVKRSLIDPPAFAVIFDRHAELVRRFVARRVNAEDVAERIELVDRDTWLARYPDAIDDSEPATTLEEVPVAATVGVPVADDTSGVRVLVANASTVNGAAGTLTENDGLIWPHFGGVATV